MGFVVKEEEYKGYKIRVVVDDDPMNPRREFDGFWKMVCFHKKYDLGDKHDYREGDYSGWKDLLKGIEEKEGKLAVVLPLYLFDHSGLAMSTGSGTFRAVDSVGWDWGQVGWIYATEGGALKEFGRDEEAVRKCLENEVELYDQYLRGEVYGYVVEDREGEHVDSCWGFYGDWEKSVLMDDARGVIDYKVKEENEKRCWRYRIRNTWRRLGPSRTR
jgi:hypothetical protein